VREQKGNKFPAAAPVCSKEYGLCYYPALDSPAQEPKPESKQADPKIDVTRTARIFDAKVQPQATMWSTLSGNTYAWVFTDPNNEYRCFVSSYSSALPSPDSFTVTCVKRVALEPTRTGVTYYPWTPDEDTMEFMAAASPVVIQNLIHTIRTQQRGLENEAANHASSDEQDAVLRQMLEQAQNELEKSCAGNVQILDKPCQR
jgi:hypothetical protein